MHILCMSLNRYGSQLSVNTKRLYIIIYKVGVQGLFQQATYISANNDPFLSMQQLDQFYIIYNNLNK